MPAMWTGRYTLKYVVICIVILYSSICFAQKDKPKNLVPGFGVPDFNIRFSKKKIQSKSPIITTQPAIEQVEPIKKKKLILILPQWFYDFDINHDGQIEMNEWTEDWTWDMVDEFLHWDLNMDGIITQEEVLKAIHKG